MREALVNKLSIAIRASLSLTDVLNTASNELGQVLSASRVRLRLFDADGKTSSPAAEYVAGGYENLDLLDDDYETFLREHFLANQEPLVINDAHKLPNGGAEFAERVRSHALLTGQRSHIECPLTVNGEFRGVITVERIRRWAEDEVLLVKSVATQLGTIGRRLFSDGAGDAMNRPLMRCPTEFSFLMREPPGARQSRRRGDG